MTITQKIFLTIFILFTGALQSFAVTAERLEETLSEYNISIPERLYIEDTLELDISNLWETLRQSFWEFDLEYEWEIFSQDPQTGPTLKVNFDSFGVKPIQLQIFTTIPARIWEDGVEIPEERQLIYRSDNEIFVYEKSIPAILSNDLNLAQKENFITSAQDQWVLVYSLWEFTQENISWEEILSKLSNYRLSFSEISDYVALWGDKEFIFSVLSRINTRLIDWESLNLVLLTPYNTSILKNYISNSIAGKDFIETWFIVDESIRTQILKYPKSINLLLEQISQNSYEYTMLLESDPISPYYFISRFISKLSNSWVTVSDIYIILLLPIFLTLVWVAKHFVGISTIGSIIPVFLSLLYIKLWIPFTLGLMIFLVIVNVSIAKIISRYTLLYTPKVTFITIINFLAFMGVFLIFDDMNLVEIYLDNIIYIIIFFVVAEKLITIIASKEFGEYKKSFSGTVIVSLICFLLYHFNSFVIFLTAYPELLLILVPFNFILWRFTGLRITEYLRFREILRSTEE